MNAKPWSNLSLSAAVARLKDELSVGNNNTIYDTVGRFDDVVVEYLLSHLQEGTGEISELRAALLDASNLLLDLEADGVAGSSEEQPSLATWADRWTYLLGVLRRAEHAPSLAAGMRAIRETVLEARTEVPAGRPEQIFRHIAEADVPVQPTDLAKALRMNDSAVSRALTRLRKASLVSVREVGRRRYYSLTARGYRLFEGLRRALPEAEVADEPTDQPLPFAEPQVYWGRKQSA